MTTDLLTVFIISMCGAWFAQAVPSRSRNIWGRRRPNFIGFLIPAAVMILYSGLRRTVGDTVYYLHTYNVVEADGMARPKFYFGAYFFETFRYYLHQINAKPETFIMITALVALVPMFILLYRYSFDFSSSVFFFFTTGLYVITMNGIRQFMATGIILLGVKYLFSPKNTDFFKFAVFVGIATFFHTSALLMIPIYFLCRQKAWSLPTFAILGGGIVVLIFVSLFLPSFTEMLADTNYSGYSQGWFDEGSQERGASLLRVAFQCIPMGLSIIFSKNLRRCGPIADILINLSVFHAAIYIISLYNWIFARFAFYTLPFMLLLLSLIVVTSLRTGKNRGLYYLMIGAYLLFFIKDAYSNGMPTYRSDLFEVNNNLWFSFIA